MAELTQKSSPQVFAPMVEEGEQELERSVSDLALSGLIAGLDIGFGPLAMAVVAGRLHELLHLSIAQALFFGGFLYPLGFVFVVMGRSELFTENTLTPVVGLLSGKGSVRKLVKRWSVVLLLNTAGAIIFSYLASHSTPLFGSFGPIYQQMGLPLVSHSFPQAVLLGIFAGWLIALMSWLIQASAGNGVKLVIIYLTTYLLVAMPLLHCVIGSIEVLLAMFAGAPITWAGWFLHFFLPAVIGNAIGGVVFVTGLKGVQAQRGLTDAEGRPSERR